MEKHMMDTVCVHDDYDAIIAHLSTSWFCTKGKPVAVQPVTIGFVLYVSLFITPIVLAIFITLLEKTLRTGAWSATMSKRNNKASLPQPSGVPVSGSPVFNPVEWQIPVLIPHATPAEFKGSDTFQAPPVCIAVPAGCARG
ncbi:hypothetical protein CC2G_002453 [Coprinopsis cinerea AmutBmut pab1-1]|nr:hypothetical protein CC2G_002453 [Coprinopsis cinerea AmutBmut pab1-1]